MVAYKVLIGGRSCFTGWQWPLPSAERAGDWVEATGPLELCTNGIHACTTAQLAQWLGEELWTIELDGEILHAEPALVAARGRLLGTVPVWNLDARRAFGEDCAGRARTLAAESPHGEKLLALIERFTGNGLAGPVGYWTAVLAGEAVTGRRDGEEYNAAFAAERELQARWLAALLDGVAA